jgi:transcriptional regulator GlxA family with amidase domain
MPKRAHRVAVLAVDGVSAFELSTPCEVFGIDRSDLVDPWYEFRVCGDRAGPIHTASGFDVQAPYTLDDLARADTVVIPAIRNPQIRPSDEVIGAVQHAARRGARMVGICTGAFVLGHAGLLEGRPATTHWMNSELLARTFPSVAVQPDVLYVDDGQVLTSAGTASGIDLCLHIVRHDHGAEVANAVARRMVVPPHRDGGQAQYVPTPVASEVGDDRLMATLDWATEHLDREITVPDLARRAAMSPRTFARRFGAVVGSTPHQWLIRQRVLCAQRLLETTDHPIERIAVECGFGSAAALRMHFGRAVGTTPTRYRRTFAGSSANHR